MAPNGKIAMGRPDMWVGFCDSHSPWQYSTNENTNGLPSQYPLPQKRSSLSGYARPTWTPWTRSLGDRPSETTLELLTTNQHEPRQPTQTSQPPIEPELPTITMRKVAMLGIYARRGPKLSWLRPSLDALSHGTPKAKSSAEVDWLL